ncbi:MAG: PQQ-dependent sugar dehydrogenase, partial [Flavisolibacter sp.]
DFLTPPYYTIPPDNPYLSDAAVDDRIYALGLRNPFRWSFDRANGNMWIGDVGQGNYEEVDFRTPSNAAAGTNYGWRCYEGPQTFNTAGCNAIGNYTFPVFSYVNPGTGAAITGGYVYRGNEYPLFRGYYIASDVYSGNVYLVWPDGSGGWNSNMQPAVQTFIAGYGEAEDGTLYAVSLNGNLYKVVATGGTPLPVVLSSFTVLHSEGWNQLRWSTSSEQGTAKFVVEYSIEGRNFIFAGQLMAMRNASGSDYDFRHYINTDNGLFYRLKMEDDNGSIRYSTILKVPGKNERSVYIYPTVVADGIINIAATGMKVSLKVIDGSGVIVYKKQLENISVATSIQLPSLPKGLYIVTLETNNKLFNKKIIIH